MSSYRGEDHDCLSIRSILGKCKVDFLNHNQSRDYSGLFWLFFLKSVPTVLGMIFSSLKVLVYFHVICSDDLVAYQARKLAHAAGTELLEVRFKSPKNRSCFLSANTCPDLSNTDISDAVLCHLFNC
jgi:hypothetical protein